MKHVFLLFFSSKQIAYWDEKFQNVKPQHPPKIAQSKLGSIS